MSRRRTKRAEALPSSLTVWIARSLLPEDARQKINEFLMASLQAGRDRATINGHLAVLLDAAGKLFSIAQGDRDEASVSIASALQRCRGRHVDRLKRHARGNEASHFVADLMELLHGQVDQCTQQPLGTSLAESIARLVVPAHYRTSSMSKGIECFNLDTPRQWFQPGRDSRDIIAGVVIDGEARWIRALERNNSITFSEAFPRDHRRPGKKANREYVKRVEAELPRFAQRLEPKLRGMTSPLQHETR
jgi:hypothetical protein